jgi:hypothetical protein
MTPAGPNVVADLRSQLPSLSSSAASHPGAMRIRADDDDEATGNDAKDTAAKQRDN